MAKVASGQWVTINGTHVLIGANGRISKGPKNMIGMTKQGATKKPITLSQDLIRSYTKEERVLIRKTLKKMQVILKREQDRQTKI